MKDWATTSPRVPWETIPEMVLSTADRFGDATAIVDGDLRLTFRELAARVRRAAGAFAGAGVNKGDRVAIWAPNSAEWIRFDKAMDAMFIRAFSRGDRVPEHGRQHRLQRKQLAHHTGRN